MKQPRNVFLISAILLTLFMQIIIPMPLPMHYVFIFFGAYTIISCAGDGMKVNAGCALFLVAMLISILGNKIPPFFKPVDRFILFSLLMIGCSPLLTGPTIDKMKRHLALGCVYGMLAIAVLSFLGYFLGFGKRLTGIVDSYMGVAGHPNFLGFYTMVSAVALASMFFRCTKMVERIIVLSLWAMCLITLLLASSRSALALALVGTMMAVYLRLQKNASAMMNTVMAMVGAVILALPYLMPFMDSMMKKNMDFDDTDSMVADTRGYIWQLRYWEIEESPVIGVGAYGCDINLPNASVFYVEKTGTIELGSSYLGLLSQCGWLGMITFLIIVVPIIIKTTRHAFKERTPYAQLWLPIIVVIALNMIFEAYLITAGAVQCMAVWLVLAAAEQSDRVADYPVAWEKWDPISPTLYEYWRQNIAPDGDKR